MVLQDALLVIGLVAFVLFGHYWARLATMNTEGLYVWTDDRGAQIVLFLSSVLWVVSVFMSGVLWDVVLIWSIVVGQALFLYVFDEDEGWLVPP